MEQRPTSLTQGADDRRGAAPARSDRAPPAGVLRCVCPVRGNARGNPIRRDRTRTAEFGNHAVASRVFDRQLDSGRVVSGSDLEGLAPRHGPFAINYFGVGNNSRGTQAKPLGTPLASRVSGNSAGHLLSFDKNATTAGAGSEWIMPGAQLQVMGAATSGSGTRLFLNERFVDVAVPFPVTDVPGAEIGRYAWSPGSSGSWGVFDLYEMIVFSPGLSNADALAVSQSLMTDHGIVPIQNQLVLEGDSITQGVGDVTEHFSSAAVLTEPGSGWIPANWRVINEGSSGAQIGTLRDRRDATDSWADQTITGQNVMAFEIGRNDWVAGSVTVADHYTNVVSYLNTSSTGVLQRGWDVRVMANIAGPAGLMDRITAHRTAIRDPQFLTDTSSGSGQAFDGQVSVVSADLIEDSGQTVFLTSDDAADVTYYAGDNTHPNILGAEVRMTGGDTPQYGVAAGL